MENEEILENLQKIVSKDKIKQNELMKKHTSIKIGGPADFLVEISTIDELKNIIQFTNNNKIPVNIIGNGSNVLVLDNGIRGITIKLEFKEIKLEKLEENKIQVIVECGVPIGLLAQTLLKEEICGFEELSGIPGTIGGAIVMNAGAHGKEIKDIVTEITAMDYNGIIHKFTNQEAQFSYRHSKFSNGKNIILKTKFLLEKGKKEQIKEKMDEYARYRKEKQPIEYPNAGSTFKRGEDFITAKLIDNAGLRGYSIGKAQISEKHAGFIINTGDATAQEILQLAEYAKSQIYEKYKKKIELEIKVIGE